MRNKHVTRFGNPVSPTGARYCVSDQEGLVQMSLDLELARIHIGGKPITTARASDILTRILRAQLGHNEGLSRKGIPTGLRDLLEATKKSEVEKICRGLTISEFELFLLIHNCYQFKFEHESKFRQYVPSHLEITQEDDRQLKSGNVRPMSKKLGPILAERRYIHVHLVYRGPEWHCFYFSYEDIEPSAANHWKHGGHLHYVSHLWPRLTQKQVWKSFEERHTKIPGDVHIRFVPFDSSDSENADEKTPVGNMMEGPGAIAFSPSLLFPRGSQSTPVAFVATRGLWCLRVGRRK